MSGIPLILATILFVYTAVAEPIFGVRLFHKLMELLKVDSTARIRFYRQTVTVQWLRVIIVGLIMIVSDIPLAKLGITLPVVTSWGFIAGLIVCVAAAVSFLRTASRPDYRENVSRAMQPVAALLPHTKGERRFWAVISVTAGICEEILFRGFLIFYLSQVLPFLPLIAVVVVSSIIFGLGHAYQGLKGVIGTGILGFGLAVLYVATGSLLLSMVIHALVDVRVLLVWRPESPHIEAPTEEAV